MIRKFEFTLGTIYSGSTVRDIYEYDMEEYEGLDEQQFLECVKEDYEQWVWDNNYGGVEEIE